jgi:biopolymer transport protein ExbD
MAGGAEPGGDDELITAINVTPLVDIVLVLLIVLMVTSAYIVNRSISVELPKAATGEASDATLSISIDVDDNLYLDGKEVSTDRLRSGIRAARRTNAEVKAIISADGRVRHAKVVSVIDLLRREKVNKFAINTSPIDLEVEKPK